jgi:hypothetical protein
MFVPKPLLYVGIALLGMAFAWLFAGALPFLLAAGLLYGAFKFFGKKKQPSPFEAASGPNAANPVHAEVVSVATPKSSTAPLKSTIYEKSSTASRESLVRTATDATVAGLRGILQPFQGEWGPGLPAGFWNDPYILGFTTIWSTYFAKQSTSGAIAGEALQAVGGLAYGAVSNESGATILRRIDLLSSERHKEFFRGISEANLILAFADGGLQNEDSFPVVVEAKIAAQAMEGPKDRTGVAALMTLLALKERVRLLENTAA